MPAQTALRATLRDQLGPNARRRGFKGSSPTWRKSSTIGDWAIVNVQSSSFSSAAHLRCVMNIAFAPEPWLRWKTVNLGPAMPKTISEHLGLYRQRLHPTGTPAGTDGWWDIYDEETAQAAVTDMTTQLEQAGWPVLEQIFSRVSMLQRLQDGDLGMVKRSYQEIYFARAEALMLMDAGPSDALVRCVGLPAQRRPE